MKQKQIEVLFGQFYQTIAALRHPKKGCPWDLKQTHRTLRRYMLEECYEAAYAMGRRDDGEMCEELGDVLLQVVLNAQLADDRKAFDVRDVIRSINDKMIRRHPHVFANKKNKKFSLDQIYANWDQTKAQEKSKKKKEGFHLSEKDLFSAFPAARAAAKIGKKTAEVNFDWQKPLDVLAQVQRELDELRVEMKSAKKSASRIREELGDVLFSIAQLARHLKVDAEEVAFEANEKFLKRFQLMEKIMREEKKAWKDYSTAQLESLWKRAKRLSSKKR